MSAGIDPALQEKSLKRLDEEASIYFYEKKVFFSIKTEKRFLILLIYIFCGV